MSFFLSDTLAQQDAALQGDSFLGLLFPIGLVVILYFLMIRPQVKRQKEHKKMVEALAKGDEVATMGGIVGRIVELGDNFARLEVAEGVEVKSAASRSNPYCRRVRSKSSNAAECRPGGIRSHARAALSEIQCFVGFNLSADDADSRRLKTETICENLRHLRIERITGSA